MKDSANEAKNNNNASIEANAEGNDVSNGTTFEDALKVARKSAVSLFCNNTDSYIICIKILNIINKHGMSY